ncbi:hypothetical protein [Oxynema sp. CENA135]|nr:hypothetical protein [Oxynema sp. CENA135]
MAIFVTDPTTADRCDDGLEVVRSIGDRAIGAIAPTMQLKS